VEDERGWILGQCPLRIRSAECRGAGERCRPERLQNGAEQECVQRAVRRRSVSSVGVTSFKNSYDNLEF